MRLKYLVCILTILFFIGCNHSSKKYVIGVVQSHDSKRLEQMNMELKREAHYYNDIDLRITSADSNNAKQTEIINKFIADSVNLLIIRPYDVTKIVPIINKAFDNNIPIIIVDEMIESDSYTSFIGADKHRIGELARQYINETFEGHCNVIELCTNEDPYMSQILHQGFTDETNDNLPHKSINILSYDYVIDNTHIVEQKVDSLLTIYPDIDFIFAHSDDIAYGASLARNAKGYKEKIKIMGVNALTGLGNGMPMVLNKLIDASILYPTNGDLMIKEAHKILTGEDYRTSIKTWFEIIDHTNVRLMKEGELYAFRLNEKIEGLNIRIATHEQVTKLQQQLLCAISLIVIIILIAMIFIIRLLRSKSEINKELNNKNILITFQNKKLELQRDELHTLSRKLDEATNSAPQEFRFLERFQELLEANISNSEFSVEQMSELMCYSRVQLYRKIKTLTGVSPNKFLRNIRLKRADFLLRNSDKSIAEITDEVGFTSQSYFSKNYKEMYGVSPTTAMRKP